MTKSRWCSASQGRRAHRTEAASIVLTAAKAAVRRLFGDIVGRVIVRLVGAVLLELNDEWQLQHRYMQTEIMAELTPTLIETLPPQISTVAA